PGSGRLLRPPLQPGDRHELGGSSPPRRGAGGAVRRQDALGRRARLPPVGWQPTETDRRPGIRPGDQAHRGLPTHPRCGRGVDRVHPPADRRGTGPRSSGADRVVGIGRDHGAVRSDPGHVEGTERGRDHTERAQPRAKEPLHGGADGVTEERTALELETEGGPKGPRPRGTLRERIAPSNVDWRTVLLVPLLAVVAALAVGAIIIALTEGPEDISTAYAALFRGAFMGVGPISETLVNATPLILAGLSVAIGFQAGLFNIGAEGQMTIGGMTAVLAGFMITGVPAIVHLPLAILAGFLGGAIWGGIPGWLRARTGAHEVISTIMLNFIAYRLVDFLLKQPAIIREGRFDPISRDALPSARLPQLLDWINPSLRLHGGFILAIVMAIVVWWVLYRTTIGFEFRAVGSNPNAASYAGMSVTFSTVTVMAFAGGLGGLAGANQILGVLNSVSPG